MAEWLFGDNFLNVGWKSCKQSPQSHPGLLSPLGADDKKLRNDSKQQLRADSTAK